MQHVLRGMVVGGLVLAAGAQGQDVGFAGGQRLRDLELPTIDGERSVRLSELRGQKLLLLQFASW